MNMVAIDAVAPQSLELLSASSPPLLLEVWLGHGVEQGFLQ